MLLCSVASYRHSTASYLLFNSCCSHLQFLAAAGNPHVRLFEIASQNPNPVVAYDGHTTNVTDIGFQKDSKWMFTGSEDGSIKVPTVLWCTCLTCVSCSRAVYAMPCWGVCTALSTLSTHG